MDERRDHSRPGLGLDGPAQFADSTAVLQGLSWAPDQKTTAVVSTTGSPMDECFQEVELRLRTVIEGHIITGYEINYKFSNDSTGYMTIVRWNGGLGDFTTLHTYDRTTIWGRQWRHRFRNHRRKRDYCFQEWRAAGPGHRQHLLERKSRAWDSISRMTRPVVPA